MKAELNAPYDPNLKQALREIEAICVKYDCGGHVNLISQTHGEFSFVLPKWQCLFEETLPDGRVAIRLRAKKANGDFPERADLTAHFLHSLRDVFAAGFQYVDRFIIETNEKWKTEHTPFKNFRPKREEH